VSPRKQTNNSISIVKMSLAASTIFLFLNLSLPFNPAACAQEAARPKIVASGALPLKGNSQTEVDSSVKRPSLKTLGQTLLGPLGAVVGVSVGVPVRIARDVAQHTMAMKEQATDDVAGSENPDLTAKTVGSYTAVAFGLVSGLISGTIKGTERGLDAGFRKPFSRESMSLKDPD
jgi:hypothetical protein